MRERRRLAELPRGIMAMSDRGRDRYIWVVWRVFCRYPNRWSVRLRNTGQTAGERTEAGPLLCRGSPVLPCTSVFRARNRAVLAGA